MEVHHFRDILRSRTPIGLEPLLRRRPAGFPPRSLGRRAPPLGRALAKLGAFAGPRTSSVVTRPPLPGGLRGDAATPRSVAVGALAICPAVGRLATWTKPIGVLVAVRLHYWRRRFPTGRLAGLDAGVGLRPLIPVTLRNQPKSSLAGAWVMAVL